MALHFIHNILETLKLHRTAWVRECRCESHLSCGGHCSECLCPPPSPARWLDASPAVPPCSLYCRSRHYRSPSLSSLLRAPSFPLSARLGLSDPVYSVRSVAAGGIEWWMEPINYQSLELTTPLQSELVLFHCAFHFFKHANKMWLCICSQFPGTLLLPLTMSNPHV